MAYGIGVLWILLKLFCFANASIGKITVSKVNAYGESSAVVSSFTPDSSLATLQDIGKIECLARMTSTPNEDKPIPYQSIMVGFEEGLCTIGSIPFSEYWAELHNEHKSFGGGMTNSKWFAMKNGETEYRGQTTLKILFLSDRNMSISFHEGLPVEKTMFVDSLIVYAPLNNRTLLNAYLSNTLTETASTSASNFVGKSTFLTGEEVNDMETYVSGGGPYVKWVVPQLPAPYSFTLMSWFKNEDPARPLENRPVIQYRQTDTWIGGVLFQVGLPGHPAEPALALVNHNTGQEMTWSSGSPDIPTTGWVHMAVSLDMAAGQIQFYLNGKPSGGAISTGTVHLHPTIYKFVVGFIDAYSNCGCSMAEVEAYSRVLSNEEVSKAFGKNLFFKTDPDII